MRKFLASEAAHWADRAVWALYRKTQGKWFK